MPHQVSPCLPISPHISPYLAISRNISHISPCLPFLSTSQVEDTRTPCPHCGRKFNNDVAERHIPSCAKAIKRPNPVGGAQKRPSKSSPASSHHADGSDAHPAPAPAPPDRRSNSTSGVGTGVGTAAKGRASKDGLTSASQSLSKSSKDALSSSPAKGRKPVGSPAPAGGKRPGAATPMRSRAQSHG